MIAFPALPIRSSSAPAAADDELSLAEFLELFSPEEPEDPAPAARPSPRAFESRRRAHSTTWRRRLIARGMALGGPRRAW